MSILPCKNAKAMGNQTMVIVSGGVGGPSGERDFYERRYSSFRRPPVSSSTVVAIKPGETHCSLLWPKQSPYSAYPAILCPGLVVFNPLCRPAIARWMGTTLDRRTTQSRLSANVASIAGREGLWSRLSSFAREKRGSLG